MLASVEDWSDNPRLQRFHGSWGHTLENMSAPNQEYDPVEVTPLVMSGAREIE
jgi:hypothetical protein